VKRLLSVLIAFIISSFILWHRAPVYAACVANGACKEVTDTCCSGYSKLVDTWTCSSQYQCVVAITPGPTQQPIWQDVCKFETKNKSACESCVKISGVYSAIGCIETTSSGLTKTLLSLGIGMAGGIAFLLILFGALQMMTSAGNPEKLNAGKELISAAISGLLLIIFSVFLLQLIGVKILAIPGFK